MVARLVRDQEAGSSSLPTPTKKDRFLRKPVFFHIQSKPAKIKPLSFDRGFIFGAGNETRTRYLHLGKVALYRMSYARIRNEINNTTILGFVKHNLSRSSIFTYYR